MKHVKHRADESKITITRNHLKTVTNRYRCNAEDKALKHNNVAGSANKPAKSEP